MNEKGAFWLLELGIALALLITLLPLTPTPPLSKNEALSHVLCEDLLGIWSISLSEEWKETLTPQYPTAKIQFLSHAPPFTSQQITCTGTRVRNGKTEYIFISIQFPTHPLDDE